MRMNTEQTILWVMSCVVFCDDDKMGRRISKICTIKRMRESCPFTLGLREAKEAYEHVFQQ